MSQPPAQPSAQQPASPASPSHRLPPLEQLPAPARLAADDQARILPSEFLLDSRRDLLRRMIRRCWLPALVLWLLWIALVALYVLGTSPTYWLISLLASLGSSIQLRSAISMMGFSGSGLTFGFLAVPLLATALSLVLLSASSAAVARLRPREMLSEQAFQRAVASRTVGPLLAPAHTVIALLVIAVILQVPLQWRGLSAGALSMLALGLGLVMLAGTILRRWYSAPRLLGIPSPSALEATALLGQGPERSRAARRVLAQDHRHLPPNHESLGPDAMLRALRATARAWERWVLPAGLGLAWIVFAITDVVVLFSRLATTTTWQQVPPAELPWQLLVIAPPLGGLLAIGLGLAPLAAMRLSRSRRAQVTDLRTYRSWADRARVNPWEASVVTRTGWLHAGLTVLAVVLLGVALSLTGALTAIGQVWLVLDVLVLVPLIGGAGAWAMRHHLRYVVYGPAGAYVRRETPFARVAPSIGTRADRADDPVVLAEIRRRLFAEAGENALEPVGIDPSVLRAAAVAGADGADWAGGPGGAGAAAGTEAADALVALPDFGAEDGISAGRAEGSRTDHGIPTSTTDLRER